MITIHLHQQHGKVVINNEWGTFSNKCCQWITSINVAWELHQLRKTWNLKPAWECALLNVLHEYCNVLDPSCWIFNSNIRHRKPPTFWFPSTVLGFLVYYMCAKNCNPLLTHLHNWQLQVFHKLEKPRNQHLFPIIPSSLCPFSPSWGNKNRLLVS